MKHLNTGCILINYYLKSKNRCQVNLLDTYVELVYNVNIKDGGINMAVKLRLKRMGSKQKPFYRIVAATDNARRDGRFIETVGTYNPITEPAIVEINEELTLKWLTAGAKPTDTVRRLFSEKGIMKAFHESKSAK